VIGVFDSGIGGLSILRALRAEMPGQRFVYVADSGHGPYGERDAAHVQARARALTRHLLAQGAQALVVACNTATAAAIALLREEHPQLPIIGVEPALKPALSLSRSGCIGVMATRGTLESEKFKRLQQSLQGQAAFVLRACDGLALAIEHSASGSAAALAHLAEIAGGHVRALQDACPPDRVVDTVVLGCPHYPLLRPLLSELLPPEVRLVDPAEAAVQRLGPLLASLGDVPEGERTGEPVLAPLQRTRLCVTGCADAFAQSAAAWLDPCPSVEQVALAPA